MKTNSKSIPALALAALFAASVLPASAQITKVNSGSFTDGGTSTDWDAAGPYNATIDAGADADLLIVGCSTELGGTTAYAVSYDGNPMTLLEPNSLDQNKVFILDLTQTSYTGGNATLSFTWTSTAGGDLGVGWVSVDGNLVAGQTIDVVDYDYSDDGQGVATSGVAELDTTKTGTFNFINWNANKDNDPALTASPGTGTFTELYSSGSFGSNAGAAAFEQGPAIGTNTYTWPQNSIRSAIGVAFAVSGPPVIATLSPPDDGSDVVATTDPVLTFNKNVALTGSGTITIKNLDDLSGSSDVTIDLSSLPDAGNDVTVSGPDLTILPAADFAVGIHYAIQISADAVVDQAATPNAFAGILDDTTWDFFIDGTAPGIAGLSPADGAPEVYLGTELVLSFDEAVELTGSGTVTIIEDPDGTPTNTVINLPNASVTLDGLDLTIVPASNLNAGSTYAVNISNDAVEDVSGNDFAGILDTTTWNFATAAADATAPVLSTKDPADDSTDVSIFTNLVATFDEDLVLGSGNITIYNVTLGSAAATIDVTDSSQVTLAGNVLTINPAANLDVSTEYAVQMDAGVVRNLNDLPSAAITDTTSWSFTTVDLVVATLTANTDLAGGTPIPTDVGDFDDTDNTAPYIYHIDNDPGNVSQQTRIDLNMAGFDLNNSGDSTQDVTINAASVSYTGGGGEFNFTGSGSRPDLTISATGAMSVWKVGTNAGSSGNNTAGAITFIAPGGIAVGNNLETSTTSNNGGSGGSISLTGTGGSGSIQIGGSVNTYSSNGNGGNGGNVTLAAASGIGVTGSINTYANRTNRDAGDITINGGTGPVSIAGTINANAGSGGTRVGNLNIITGDQITLATLDLSLLYQVSLQGSSVEIDTLLNLGISGSDVTGFHNVSSDVFYNPANSPSLNGLTYNILEGNGETGYQLKPIITSGSYATWADGTFANGTLTDKTTTGDDEGDGLTNLHEYAFGTDPTVNFTGPMVYVAGGNVTTPGQPVLLAEGGTYYAVFGRRKDHVAAGLTYTVQFSADLSSPWVDSTAIPELVTGDPSAGDIEAVRVPFPGLIATDSGPQEATFFRLQVELAE